MRHRWLLPLGLFVASCSGASNDDSSEDGSGDLDLTYRSFYSESLEGRELVPNSVLSLYFNPGGLSADDGCNQTYGDYHFEDDRLVFQPAGQSDDECSTWLVEQAIWFVMFLQMSPTIRLVEPRLILSNGREILTLNDDQEPIPDRPLAGTNWVGSGIDEGAGLMGGPSLSNLTVRFGSDGRFDAFSGCQRVTGGYAASDRTITFTDFVPDLMPCSDPALEALSSSFFFVFDNRTGMTFEIKGTQLTLQNVGITLYFTAAE
jgi:heat shock protein HslJ